MANISLRQGQRRPDHSTRGIAAQIVTDSRQSRPPGCHLARHSMESAVVLEQIGYEFARFLRNERWGLFRIKRRSAGKSGGLGHNGFALHESRLVLPVAHGPFSKTLRPSPAHLNVTAMGAASMNNWLNGNSRTVMKALNDAAKNGDLFGVAVSA